MSLAGGTPLRTMNRVGFTTRIHGLPPGSSPGRTAKAEYDLANPLQARIEAKLMEFAALGIAMTEPTMFRNLAD